MMSNPVTEEETEAMEALKAEANGELERLEATPLMMSINPATLMLITALASNALAGTPAPAELLGPVRQLLDIMSKRMNESGFPAIGEMMWALLGHDEAMKATAAEALPMSQMRSQAEVIARCQRLARLMTQLRQEGQLAAMAEPRAALAALRWVLSPTLSPLQSHVAAMDFALSCEEESR